MALTADPARHAERILAAAQANLQAGAFGKALELLADARRPGRWMSSPAPGWTCCAGRSRSPRAWAATRPPLLLKAAKRLEPLDLDLARETYLSAWMAALFAGRLAGAGDLLEVSRAARALPPPADPPRPVDLVLDGLALLVTDGAGRRGADVAAGA